MQVEHPVTEGITGVNIPACQLLIGMGVPLWRIPAIRALYCQDPRGTSAFDLEAFPQKVQSNVAAVTQSRPPDQLCVFRNQVSL